MVQKCIRAGSKNLVWFGFVSGLLIAFCWLFLYVGSVDAFSRKTPTSIAMTPTVKPTPQIIVVNTPAATQSNPQDNITVTILIALLSGSFGAIIGSVIQARINNSGLMKATEKQAQSLFQATEQQIKSLYEQERANREYTEKQQQEVTRQALIAEIKETIDFLTQESIIPLLSTEAWALYKGNIAFLPVSLQEELIKGYAEIKRCNAYFEMNMTQGITMEGKVVLGHSIDPQKKIVLDICRSLSDQLSQK